MGKDPEEMASMAFVLVERDLVEKEDGILEHLEEEKEGKTEDYQDWHAYDELAAMEAYLKRQE